MRFVYLLPVFVIFSQLSETSGEWNITCDSHNNSKCDSDSLEEIADNVTESKQHSVHINIMISKLYLEASVSFTNLMSLTIAGEPSTTEISCGINGNSSIGILFGNITSVTLNHIKLTLCGTIGQKYIITALVICNCRNVNVHRVIIERSRGVGMQILYSQAGKVNITSSVFKENKLPRKYIDSESVWGGGGIYLVLNEFNQSNMSFHFYNCTFENNTAHIYKYDLDFMNNRVGYGHGGGVCVSIHGVKHVQMKFSNCTFTLNGAYFGGGLSVRITDKNNQETQNITVKVEDSLFLKNGCILTGQPLTHYGGGVNFVTETFSKNLHVTSSIEYFVKNTNFTGNCARIGGGITYYYKKLCSSIIFEDCKFSSNQGQFGSAVELHPSTPTDSTCFRSPPVFTNCEFSMNVINETKIHSHVNQKAYGLGTVFISRQKIEFQGRTSFENNYGTAIYVVNGLLNFTKSNVSFTNNTGIDGGALTLTGESTMFVGPNAEYSFINNTALNRGGAVYVELIDIMEFISASARVCFIQCKDCDVGVPWNINITFSSNKATNQKAGHSIYVSSIHPCQIWNNGTKDKDQYIILKDIRKVFCLRGMTFDDHHQIATDGSSFNTNKPNNNSGPLMIIPGEKFKHNVTIIDDLEQVIDTSLRVAIKGNKHVQLSVDSSQYIGSEIQLNGTPHQSAYLIMYSISSARQIHIHLEVELLDCPPGFKLDKNSVCTCNIDAYVGLDKCDSDTLNSFLHPGYWAGVIKKENGSNEELITSTCPFCDFSFRNTNTTGNGFELRLPRNSSNLDQAVCGETRTGYVCGKCKKNYTVHFHSPGYLCKPADPFGCKLGWLFYALSELVPVTIIFITILFFNISFTSGAINGFILFSQLLDTWSIEASGIIVLPHPVSRRVDNWIQGYQIIYGFFNIDFFTSESLSFCLWKDASALDVLSVKYITILYSLVLMVVVVLVMNNCGGRWPCRYCRISTMRASIIHGISTFLVMCYAQCVKVSLSLLVPVYFFVSENSKSQPPPRVWLNGELIYFSKEHLVYALPALFCLLTIGLLPPILLLTHPLINKLMTTFGFENVKIFKYISQKMPTSSLKPLLDSIQGCFKDNLRFFAGLYFLYRWMILIIHMRSNSFSVYYVAVGCFLLFLLTLHMICQPYIKRVHNIIDTLLFSNLVLLNFLSFFNYQRSHSKSDTERLATVSPSVIQLLLIYLPLIAIVVYTLAMVCKKCDCKQFLTTLSFTFIPQRAKGLRDIVKNMSETDEDEESNWEDSVYDRLLENRSSLMKYSAQTSTD